MSGCPAYDTVGELKLSIHPAGTDTFSSRTKKCRSLTPRPSSSLWEYSCLLAIQKHLAIERPIHAELGGYQVFLVPVRGVVTLRPRIRMVLHVWLHVESESGHVRALIGGYGEVQFMGVRTQLR